MSWLETIQGFSPTTGITDCFMKHDVVGRDLFLLKREDLFDLGITRVPDARRIMNAIDGLKGSDNVAFGGTDEDGCSADALSDIFGDSVIGVGELPDINKMPTTEADYWRLVEYTFILRLLLLRSTSDIAHDLYLNASNGRRSRHSALLPDNALHPETPDRNRELKQRRSAIEELLQKIEQSISLNIESMDASASLSPPSWTPVLAKIAKTYKMSDAELDVLRFITTVKITKSALLRSLLPSDDHAETPLVEDSCRCTLVQYVCCLSQLQMSSITDESRPLVIDRVLGEISDDVLATEFKFVVPDEVCRLLFGEPLSTEDRLKLAGTRLQNIDVVAIGSEQQVPAKGSAPSSIVSGEGANASATKTIKKMLGDLTMENEGEGLGIEDLDIESLDSDVAALIEGEGGDDEDMLDEETDSREPRPYTCELDYLSDQFSMIMQQIQVANQRLQRDLKQASLESPDRWMRKEGRKSASLGELSAKLSLSKRKIEASLELTRKEGKFYPRLEELVRQLQLDVFEKSVLIYLVGSMISPLFKSSIASDSLRGLVGSGRKCSVGDLLQVFCESVAEQVAARTHFYRTSKMIEKGLIRLTEGYGVSDLTDQEVQLDRRVLDCIVGLDKESTEVIQGSYLYDPAVDINSVVLAPGLKEAILSSTVNFDKFLRYRKQSSFDEAISYGVGLTLMFSGASGTGKVCTNGSSVLLSAHSHSVFLLWAHSLTCLVLPLFYLFA